MSRRLLSQGCWVGWGPCVAVVLPAGEEGAEQLHQSALHLLALLRLSVCPSCAPGWAQTPAWGTGLALCHRVWAHGSGHPTARGEQSLGGWWCWGARGTAGTMEGSGHPGDESSQRARKQSAALGHLTLPSPFPPQGAGGLPGLAPLPPGLFLLSFMHQNIRMPGKLSGKNPFVNEQSALLPSSADL